MSRYTIPLIILLCMSVSVLANSYNATCTGTVPPTISAWVIENETVCENGAIIIDGQSIEIGGFPLTTGDLTLDNVTLIFTQDTNDFTVNQGRVLINRSTIRTNISTGQGWYLFVNNASVVVIDSNLSNMGEFLSILDAAYYSVAVWTESPPSTNARLSFERSFAYPSSGSPAGDSVAVILLVEGTAEFNSSRIGTGSVGSINIIGAPSNATRMTLLNTTPDGGFTINNSGILIRQWYVRAQTINPLLQPVPGAVVTATTGTTTVWQATTDVNGFTPYTPTTEVIYGESGIISNTSSIDFSASASGFTIVTGSDIIDQSKDIILSFLELLQLALDALMEIIALPAIMIILLLLIILNIIPKEQQAYFENNIIRNVVMYLLLVLCVGFGLVFLLSII